MLLSRPPRQTVGTDHSAEATMPTLRVELFEGRTIEQKRALAAALTEATVRTLGGSPDGIDVVFFDIRRHDWSTGGVLWSDKSPAVKPPGA
jgi:4-oxalocrotonate tautomerase